MTERRRAAEHSRFQSSALDAVSDVVIAIDNDQRITYWNAAAARLYGYQSHEVMGKPLSEVNQYRWHQPEDEQAAYDALAANGIWHGENIHLKRSGEEICVESSVSLLKDEHGNLTGMLAVIRDVTARKLAEGEMRRQKEILEKIFDHIPVLISFWDEEGRLKMVNREWERTLGWTLEEISEQNRDILTEIYPDLGRRREALDFMARASGEWGDFKPTLRDGRMIDVAWAHMRLSDGTRIGIGQDISERKQAEDRLRLIIDTIPAMVSSAWPDGSVDYVNQRWLNYTGQPLAEGRGWGWQALIHPDDLARTVNNWLAAMVIEEPIEMESRVRRADGEYRWFLHRSMPLRDKTGNIVRWYSTGTDIEDRKRAEDAVRQSESRLVETQRMAHVGSWERDLQSEVAFWSDEIYRICGVTPEDFHVSHAAFLEMVHPEDRDRLVEVVEGLLRDHRPVSHYCRIIRPNREVRLMHSHMNVVLDEQGNPVRMFGAAQDVTEQKLAEEQLKISNEKLRALSARLQTVREEESRRIAREIHDDLGGALTGLKMDLSWLGKRLPDSSPNSNNEAIRQKLKSMAELIDETIQEVRNLSTELRPSVLDDLGLAAAIEWQAREFQRRTEIRCQITALAEVALSPEKSIAVFRIFQEALTNAVRHSGATRVEVFMEEQGDNLILKISDNGKGIKESDLADRRSLGLLGMHERAVVFGGHVDIIGVEGAGTAVTVSIPRE